MRTTVSLLLFTVATLCAQVIRPPEAANQLAVAISGQVSPKDSSTGLYTYTYTVTNASSSKQEMWIWTLALSGDAASPIVNAVAPTGWEFAKHFGDGTVSWAATKVDSIPSQDEDQGDVVPSSYQVKPGQSLSGFSFQTPQPTTTVKFYAQGFTQLPVAGDVGDLDAAGYILKDDEDDSIIGVTRGPLPTSTSDQPSALGFFSFEHIINDAVLKSPVTISVHLNQAAGSFDPKSLRISLNGSNITALFTPNLTNSDLQGLLSLQSTPLIVGKNILEGTLPGIPLNGSSSKTDVNTVRFYVDTPRNLDLNGDGEVNCADLAIVTASFGKKAGQLGFDPRADVTGDGVVDIHDLASVSRQITTPCGVTR